MKNKVQIGLAALFAVIVLFVGLEFRRRALTVLCPALLGVGIVWAIGLVFANRKDGNWLIQLIAAGVLTCCGIVAMIIGFDVVEITASDVGVLETWEDGVSPEPLKARTYIAFPNERIYIHSLGQKKLEIGAKDPRHPEYKVQSSDNQDMFFTLQVTWKRMSSEIAKLHSSLKPSANLEETDRAIEDTFIVPVVLKTVNDCATVQEAIAVYSGLGRVELHKAIVTSLQDPKGQLAAKGIEIEDCVIKEIRLDEKYVENIQARQVAQVRATRAAEEEKAATAEALVAKAEAQKLLNTRVTEAETKKQETVLASEAENETKVLAAKADAEKVVAAATAEAEQTRLAATAKSEAALMEAKGIIALGEAQAAADKLKYAAYESPGAQQFARIEISRNMATAFSGIRGYLPESMNVFTLGADFTKAVEAVVAPK